jgi:sugar lactone lactonase YvrE
MRFPSNQLGEGPVWHPERNSFLWVDIEQQQLFEWKPGQHDLESWPMPEHIGMVALMDGNNVLVALQSRLALFDLGTGELQDIVTLPTDHLNLRPNDGKCDAHGRLWLGILHVDAPPGSGCLLCFEGGKVKTVLTELTISNGMAWTADQRYFYFIDSAAYAVNRYFFDVNTGDITFDAVAIRVPENYGMPDGMSIDQEGMLWVAHWNGFAVRRWNPIDGSLLQTIDVPAPQVTSCAFGGKNMDELFITTAYTGMTDDQLQQYPLSGQPMVVQCNVKGVASYPFFYPEKR